MSPNMTVPEKPLHTANAEPDPLDDEVGAKLRQYCCTSVPVVCVHVMQLVRVCSLLNSRRDCRQCLSNSSLCVDITLPSLLTAVSHVPGYLMRSGSAFRPMAALIGGCWPSMLDKPQAGSHISHSRACLLLGAPQTHTLTAILLRQMQT